MLIITDKRILGDIGAEISRLRSLLTDLEAIAAGHQPSFEVLAAAPELWATSIAKRIVPCLIGDVIGHPTLMGPQICTSELIALAPISGWARTMSRFYRLSGDLMPSGHLPQ